jgi:hypothetical protein
MTILLRIRIRDSLHFWPRDPEWVKIPDRIRDEQPGSYFRELKKFLGLKCLNYLMRIRDGNNSDPGWKKFGSGINILDPQHWRRSVPSERRPTEAQRDPWDHVFLQRLISPSVNTNLFVVRSSVSFKVHNGLFYTFGGLKSVIATSIA